MAGFASANPNSDRRHRVRQPPAHHDNTPSDAIGLPVHGFSALRFARINARPDQWIADSDEPPHWVEGHFFAEKCVRP